VTSAGALWSNDRTQSTQPVAISVAGIVPYAASVWI
jgi:hypothetical protein